METIFDLCVQWLTVLAHTFGMTYKEVNVWIFIILWPIFTIILLLVIVWQQWKIRALRK